MAGMVCRAASPAGYSRGRRARIGPLTSLTVRPTTEGSHVHRGDPDRTGGDLGRGWLGVLRTQVLHDHPPDLGPVLRIRHRRAVGTGRLRAGLPWDGDLLDHRRCARAHPRRALVLLVLLRGHAG